MAIPGVVETLEKLKQLHIKKNEDYSPPGNPTFNFDVATNLMSLFTSDSDKVFATMIGIKLARIAVLLNKGYAVPNYESVLDSFDDLIVYTAIWKASRTDIFQGTTSAEPSTSALHKSG